MVGKFVYVEVGDGAKQWLEILQRPANNQLKVN
jgi:hypothetical protein